ncbi:hypothetical protein EHW99_3440 [Erwinia amylovora]|uniref:Uncharacterized protein n=3 Tax=Erwinia amylovora TaxID=552 RepID=A0A831A1U5_ERWAM|nr:hypothetical protein EaACW_3512 [Erwinia amylovora ACW56400]QJQ56139.1 hypothetical protein EHX00_3440 [Erwinia amylovora]CBA23756.1 hypothetical protein predicted by Glimmer/Critica [Erwinia amylovora CFBP1430]CBX82372.1 hypothetical protein predicted by Glimmer/Critica [Erwinia amylovora ATCC BAA-2158]CCO80351.1 hypothetical protein BN432_3583 [Erwinia amylovora Ea356]CCO84157.1 hypothetical protein BN433_3612 [Erwinia amylovora Ea266]CCO87916.1 hypothetical protein BN434_3558 [Erwinia a
MSQGKRQRLKRRTTRQAWPQEMAQLLALKAD